MKQSTEVFSYIRTLGMAFLLLVSTLHNAMAEETEWKQKKNKYGISVYTKTTNLSKFKKFKADAVIDAPIQVFINLLDDPSSYVNWMDGVEESKSVKKVSDIKAFNYIVQAVPLLRDRHAVLEVDKIMADDSVTYLVEYTDESKKLMPDTNKYIPIKLMKGFYRFTKISDTQTKVEMEAVADPAGSIPAFAANMFVAKTPYKTLLNLKEITKKSAQNGDREQAAL